MRSRDAQVCELTFLPGARALSAMSTWTRTDGRDVSCRSGLNTSSRAHAHAHAKSAAFSVSGTTELIVRLQPSTNTRARACQVLEATPEKDV